MNKGSVKRDWNDMQSGQMMEQTKYTYMYVLYMLYNYIILYMCIISV